MIETAMAIGNGLVWLVSVGAACGVLWKWVAAPLKSIQSSIDVITDDIGDLLCDRLTQAHDYWMKRGYCPQSDKCRLLDMHRRYTGLGRNHLAASYEQDLLRLPERRPDAESGGG